MNSRIPLVRRNAEGGQAVHVDGIDAEQCALALEVAGVPVVRLESGGFFTEWNSQSEATINSGKYRVSREALDWRVVEWREIGRLIFRVNVIDDDADLYSRDPSWGTEDLEESYDKEMAQLVTETAGRMRMAMADDVLVMCAWRVFDRLRGLITARYGLGGPDEEGPVMQVIDKLGLQGPGRDRLRHLWSASQAWW